MAKVISVTNQKGGVGKTTTAVNLSAALGALGKRVLLIDMDPQGNTTSGVGIEKKGIKCGAYEMIIGEASVIESIKRTNYKNLSVIPGTTSLSMADKYLQKKYEDEDYLSSLLKEVTSRFDYILFDCPPSLGYITASTLCSSNSVLIPIQCEFYALEGLSQLIATVQRIRKNLNQKLDIEGILLTMYDSRLNLTQQVEEEVKKYFDDKVFKTVIPRAVRLSEAPSYGKPVMYFDRMCKGSWAYESLAKEIVKKNKEWKEKALA